jgi:glycosyltransferase involved in cell wall biosynthesis
MKFQTISIIIPVYNEEKFIVQTIKNVFKARSFGLNKEIIVVDDGSTDQTFKNIKNIKNIPLVLIHKENNIGKGAAVRDGISRSTGEIVLIQDADWEYDPADYVKLLNPILKDQADVVYGNRFHTKKSLVNLVLTSLSNLTTGLKLNDMETGYKVFKKNVIKSIVDQIKSNGFDFEPEITSKISRIKNLKIKEVNINYQPRNYKQGKKINFFDGIMTIISIFKYRYL